MTIEKIFIPTVKRINQQVTYNNLPDSLKKKVVMVVQEWERPQYDYPVEYLVLPSDIHYKDRDAIGRTRYHIFHAGKNMKYAMLDDDILFARRNAKYWGEESNMEKSKQLASEEDILEMFDLYDQWLDEKTVCACSFAENPPNGKLYQDNTSISSAWWLNGNHFKDDLDNIDFPDLGVAEDAYFILQLLSKGYSNRVSQEFVFLNESVRKANHGSPLWDNRDFDCVHEDRKYIQRMLPDVFKILYDEHGNRVPGGFRNYGKVKISWSKAYKSRLNNDLGDFYE